MTATQIQLISVPVGDQDRAKAFYGDVLGFETVADQIVSPEMRWIQMRPPTTPVSLSLVTWFPSMPAGSLRGLVIESDDLDADVARLAEADVDLGEGIREEPWGRFVTFADPDGNGLVLQTLAPPA